MPQKQRQNSSTQLNIANNEPISCRQVKKTRKFKFESNYLGPFASIVRDGSEDTPDIRVRAREWLSGDSGSDGDDVLLRAWHLLRWRGWLILGIARACLRHDVSFRLVRARIWFLNSRNLLVLLHNRHWNQMCIELSWARKTLIELNWREAKT